MKYVDLSIDAHSNEPIMAEEYKDILNGFIVQVQTSEHRRLKKMVPNRAICLIPMGRSFSP